jgi:glyoxylase-like metal-dependent hydrolase (beta-lactamase superfamily II)
MPPGDEAAAGTPPREIAPGLFHWSAFHPDQRVIVSSYYVEPSRVLIDPMVPDDGLSWFEARAPEHVLLTNRYHSRGSAAFLEAFGCPVRCHRAGLDHVRERVRAAPFEHGEILPGGIEALAVPGYTPDETTLHVPAAGGALTFADILVREGESPLGFAPDKWYGDDPEPAKTRVVEACRALVALDFRHLLPTHGDPIVDDGKTALEAFVGKRGR